MADGRNSASPFKMRLDAAAPLHERGGIHCELKGIRVRLQTGFTFLFLSGWLTRRALDVGFTAKALWTPVQVTLYRYKNRRSVSVQHLIIGSADSDEAPARSLGAIQKWSAGHALPTRF